MFDLIPEGLTNKERRVAIIASVKSRLFNLLAGLSLLLGIASAGLWVRSWWIRENISYRTTHHGRPGVFEFTAFSGNGIVGFAYLDTFADFPAGCDYGKELTSDSLEWWTFEYRPQKWVLKGETVIHRTIMLPHWLFVVLAAAIPVRWLMLKMRLRQRLELGLCINCGYDLRVSKVRCPECGADPARP